MAANLQMNPHESPVLGEPQARYLYPGKINVVVAYAAGASTLLPVNDWEPQFFRQLVIYAGLSCSCIDERLNGFACEIRCSHWARSRNWVEVPDDYLDRRAERHQRV